MCIQWMFINVYLFCQIIVVIILISPLFGPKNYNNLIQFWLFITIKIYRTGVYFLSLLVILIILLYNSMKEMQKLSYSNIPGHTQLSVKLFNAQRNFYISGFSIFLAFVIRRLTIMLIYHYEEQLKTETIINKTEKAVILARQRIIQAEQFLEEYKIRQLLTTEGQDQEGEDT